MLHKRFIHPHRYRSAYLYSTVSPDVIHACTVVDVRLLLRDTGLACSLSEAARLIDAGAIRVDGTDMRRVLIPSLPHERRCVRVDVDGKVISRGRRAFVRVVSH